MRSWSKWVIFSRKWKSSSSVGPRSPALSEWSVSGRRSPWLVVRKSLVCAGSSAASEPGPSEGRGAGRGRPLGVVLSRLGGGWRGFSGRGGVEQSGHVVEPEDLRALAGTAPAG